MFGTWVSRFTGDAKRLDKGFSLRREMDNQL
jgi:hypothetical protein